MGFKAISRLCLLLFASIEALPHTGFSQSTSQVRWWRGSYDDALEEAKHRNVPLIVVIIQDDEEANERLVDGVIKTKEFAALCEKALPIILSRRNHGTSPVDVDGTTFQGCKRFGYVPCDTHIGQEAKIILEIFEGKPVKTPQVMYLTPEANVEETVIDVAGPGEYLNALHKVLKKIGPGLDRKTFADVKKNLEIAKSALANGIYNEAYNAANAVLASGIKSTIATSATRIVETCVNHMDRRAEEIRALAKSGEYFKTYEILEQLEEAFKGSEIEKKLLALERELRATKEGRAAAVDFDKQKKHAPTYKRAQEFEAKSDFVKAREQYLRVATQIPSLPLGKKAQERLDHFEKDAAIRTLLDADRNQKAQALLERARKLAADGKRTESEAAMDQILRDYPRSKAADEVRGLRGAK